MGEIHSLSDNQMINKLRKRWSIKNDEGEDSFRIIGQFFNHNKNLFRIEDLRDLDFAKLIKYDDSVIIEDIIVELHYPKLKLPKDGEYYEFYIKLSHKNSQNPLEITVDETKSLTLVCSREIVTRIYNSIYNTPLSSRRRDTSMLDTLKNQLTQSGKEVFIYELLQNANDYPVSKGEKVDVEFYLTDNYLIFQHTGSVFSARNFAAICTINDQDKTANVETIGYKGIGFKTVFLLNDYVYLQSADYRIRFDRKVSQEVEAMPWQILPVWTESIDIDKEIESIFSNSKDDFRVQFALRPIRKETMSVFNELLRSTFSSERDILFIPNINSVKVFIHNRAPIYRNKDFESWVVTDPTNKDYIENISAELRESINDEIKRGENDGSSKIPSKYRNLDKTSVSFACKKKGNVIIPIDNANLYCYLPTKADFGFKFLLNTDMVPNGPRDSIEPIELNYDFAEIAGLKFFRWIKNLLNEDKYDIGTVFKLIPDFNSCKREHKQFEKFISRFKKGFEDCLYREPFIPVEGGCALLGNILYDQTKITSSGILTDEEFLKYAQVEYQIPLHSIRDDIDFNCFLSRYIRNADKRAFTKMKLAELCGKKDFQSWLQIQENNTKLLDFIIERDYDDYIYNKNKKVIFLGHDGNLFRCDELFYDIDEYIQDLECFSDKLPRLSSITRNFLNNNKKWNKNNISHFRKFDIKDTLEKLLKNNISDVSYLGTKVNSISFIHFLSKHYKDCRNILSDYDIPFFNTDDELVSTFRDKFVFYASEEEAVVKSQSWLSTDWVEFISNDYLEYDIDKVEKLLESVRVKNFSHEIIISEIIKKNKFIKCINTNLQSADACISFAKYTFAHEDKFNVNQLAQFNLFLNDSDGKEVFGTAGNNTFFYSEDYEEVQRLAWVDSAWMRSLSDEYFNKVDSLKFKQFLSSKFGVKEISPKIFFNTIVLKHVSDIKNNIKDVKNNISFWRWIKENVPESANKVRSWPIFVKRQDADRYSLCAPAEVYLSNDYVKDKKGIEFIVKKYYPESYFIVSDYLEDELEETKIKWIDFLKSIGVKVSVAGLLFSKIIPNLSDIEDDSLPVLLAQERENLKSQWEDKINELQNLKLKVNDGSYQLIKDCKFINCSDKVIEPFKRVIIPHEYNIKSCPSEVRRLILDIAESIPNNGNIIENYFEWEKEKLNLYLVKQDQNDISNEEHFQIIKELLSFNDYSLHDLKDYVDKILLMSVNNELLPAKELTLGTLYRPLCDFEANGVNELKFLSNEYGKNLRKPLLEMFYDLHYNFEKTDIPLLKNLKFARYFWCEYLFGIDNSNSHNNQSHIEKLFYDKTLFNDSPCIPTTDGVNSPKELYSIELVHYLDKIVGWESKFPCKELRDIIKKNKSFFDNAIVFKTELDFTDCLDALVIKKNKKERCQLTVWLKESYVDNKYDKQIEAYRQRKEAVWTNGLGESVSILELCVVNPSDKTLHSMFCQDKLVLDDSFINSSCLEDVCKILKIPFVDGDSGIKFEPVGSTNKTETIFGILEPKLLLIAAFESQSEFSEKFEQFRCSLQKLKFCVCEKISLSFKTNSKISRDDKPFYYDEKENTVNYVGKWDSPLFFMNIVEIIIETLNISIDKVTIGGILLLINDELKEYIEHHFAKLLLDDKFYGLLSEYFWDIAERIDRTHYKQPIDDGASIGFIEPTNLSPINDGSDGTTENPDELQGGGQQISRHGGGQRTSSYNFNRKPRTDKNDDITENGDYTQRTHKTGNDIPPRQPEDWKTKEITPKLQVADASDSEIEAIRNLIDESKTGEEIVDEHYLCRWRMFQDLNSKGFKIGDEKKFVSSNDSYIKLQDGSYIYTRSAKGGILFVSAFLWNKLETKSGILCMYYGNKASDFELIYSTDELVKKVGSDNILIQIKEKDKQQTIKKVFNGRIDTLDTHVLIRIKSNERYNSLFCYINKNNDANSSNF